jgi:hypothetical protein
MGSIVIFLTRNDVRDHKCFEAEKFTEGGGGQRVFRKFPKIGEGGRFPWLRLNLIFTFCCCSSKYLICCISIDCSRRRLIYNS